MFLMKQCADDTSVFLDGSKMSLYNKSFDQKLYRMPRFHYRDFQCWGFIPVT